jgi:hypothetical protein
MAKKIYEGMSFDALCKKYLTEGADLAALSEEGAAPMEEEMDEFDAEMDAPVDEFGAEEVETEGDVTITLSADLIAALRSILALVDSEEGVEEEIGASEDVEPMEDEVDEYQDEVEAEGEDEQEGIYEEQEETVLGDGQGAQAAVVSASSSAPSRKKGTPAVDRKGTGEGDFSKVTSREGEAATAVGAPERKKGTPAVDRKATVTAHKAKVGKKVLDIQR